MLNSASEVFDILALYKSDYYYYDYYYYYYYYYKITVHVPLRIEISQITTQIV